jgi:hypothetical protein
MLAPERKAEPVAQAPSAAPQQTEDGKLLIKLH